MKSDACEHDGCGQQHQPRQETPHRKSPKSNLEPGLVSTAGHSKRDRPKRGRQGHQTKRGHQYRAKAGPAMLPGIANRLEAPKAVKIRAWDRASPAGLVNAASRPTGN